MRLETEPKHDLAGRHFYTLFPDHFCWDSGSQTPKWDKVLIAHLSAAESQDDPWCGVLLFFYLISELKLWSQDRITWKITVWFPGSSHFHPVLHGVRPAGCSDWGMIVVARFWSELDQLTDYRLVHSITGGGAKKEDAEKQKEDVLNVFSVASGHLYERFLRWVAFSHTHTHTVLSAPSLKPIVHPPFLLQNNDVVRPSAYQNTRQVLVPQKLPVPLFQGKSSLLYDSIAASSPPSSCLPACSESFIPSSSETFFTPGEADFFADRVRLCNALCLISDLGKKERGGLYSACSVTHAESQTWAETAGKKQKCAFYVSLTLWEDTGLFMGFHTADSLTT